MTTRVVVITGPVGAGKTTVVDAARAELAARRVTCAAIDQDALRMVSPPPPGDRFGEDLGYRNLASVWPNLIEAGATVVLIATVVEDRAHSLDRMAAAMPRAQIDIVRLEVPMGLVQDRLAKRERTPDGLRWHQARAQDLQSIMVAAAVEDLVVDVGARSPEAVATEVISRLGLAPG